MGRANHKFRTIIIIAAIIVSTVIAFWPTLRNGFIALDDPDYVTNNPHVIGGLSWGNVCWAMQTHFFANWHPLTWLSHMLDVQLFGVQPRWHHLICLLFHVANGVLLFLLFKRMTASEWPSAFVAALFTLHPLRVESVAWISERKDHLSAFFFILTVMAYVEYARSKCWHSRSKTSPNEHFSSDRGHPSIEEPHFPISTHSIFNLPGWAYYVLALFLFALGLMSKPMVVTLPCVLLLLDFWPLRRMEPSPLIEPGHFLQLMLEKVPFFLLVIGSSLISYSAMRENGAVSIGLPLLLRINNAIVSYVKYLGKTVWPTNLAIYYQHPNTRYFAGRLDPHYPASTQWPSWAIALSLLLLVAICAAVILWRKRAPWLLVGWFWYLGTFVPVIGIIQVGGHAMADRYTYIPHIGLFLCVVWTLSQWPRHATVLRRVLVFSSVALLVGLAWRTHDQVRYWRDDFTVFQHALAVSPDNAVAQYHVGSELAHRGQYDESFPHFEAALKSNPWLLDSYRGLGMLFERQGKLDQAVQQYQTALERKPSLDWPHVAIGAVLWKLGRNDEALSHYAEALRLNPASAEAHGALGIALLKRNQIEEATVHLAQAVRLYPGYDEARRAFAEALMKQGRLSDAEIQYRELADRTPTNFQARINLGGILWRTGKRDEARNQYAEALRLNPNDAVAHFNMGTVLAADSKLDRAAIEFGEAIQLNTNYSEAYTELGRLLAKEGKMGQAEAKFREAARINPSNANLQINLGNSLMLARKTNEARFCFETALRLEPDLVDKQVASAKALLTQGQLNPALARLRTALWLNPNAAEVHELLGQILAQQGKTQEAGEHLSQARVLRQNP
jgi:tetratricopeptide (TPR) repeat protein